MGRKRGVPARARENAVAESAAEAVEVEQREALLSAKSDAELFIVDTVGENIFWRIRMLIIHLSTVRALVPYPQQIVVSGLRCGT